MAPRGFLLTKLVIPCQTRAIPRFSGARPSIRSTVFSSNHPYSSLVVDLTSHVWAYLMHKGTEHLLLLCQL